MSAPSSRRRATPAVAATRPGGTSHLVLVQPAVELSPSALAQVDPSAAAFEDADLSPIALEEPDASAGALAKADTAQHAGALAQPEDHRLAFCAKLRAARERRGIPLTSIAATTKVSVSHLAALERNDLSRWPTGIYRRAWIRGYAAAVGLPVDATTDEFLVAFDPTPPRAADAVSESSTTPEAPLRLMLAPVPVPPWSRLRSHALDIIVAVLLAILVAWATESSAWVVIGVLALCAYAPLVEAVRRLATKATKV